MCDRFRGDLICSWGGKYLRSLTTREYLRPRHLQTPDVCPSVPLISLLQCPAEYITKLDVCNRTHDVFVSFLPWSCFPRSFLQLSKCLSILGIVQAKNLRVITEASLSLILPPTHRILGRVLVLSLHNIFKIHTFFRSRLLPSCSKPPSPPACVIAEAPQTLSRCFCLYAADYSRPVASR